MCVCVSKEIYLGLLLGCCACMVYGVCVCLCVFSGEGSRVVVVVVVVLATRYCRSFFLGGGGLWLLEKQGEREVKER